MFSKLTFSINGKNVDFHIHELVSIVSKVCKDYPLQPIQMMRHDQWHFILDDINDQGTFMHALKTDALDPILFVPPHIGNLTTPAQWHSVKASLMQIPTDSSLVSWWFLIAGRLIAVKNKNACDIYLSLDSSRENMPRSFIQKIKDIAIVIFAESNGNIPVVVIKDGSVINSNCSLIASRYAYETFIKENDLKSKYKLTNNKDLIAAIINDINNQDKNIGFSDYRFYVTDHGFLSDIIHGVKETLINTNWLNPTLARCILNIWKNLLTIVDGSPEDQAECDKWALSIADDDIETIKQFHPNKADDELRDIQERLRHDKNYRLLEWKKCKQEIYFSATVVEEFIRLKSYENNDFDHDIYESYGLETIESDITIKKMVLASLAKNINRGVKTSIFRPVFAYGTDAQGDKYTTFAERIRAYLQRNPHLTDASIVSEARKVLANIVGSDDLDFLPNLMVAWFVAEAVRNSNASLLGLMVLDMIENSASLSRALIDNGIPLYNWCNVLTYSEQRHQAATSTITDGYGAPLPHYELGGVHPMAHHRSERQCRPLRPGDKLTVVQQKEGSLTAHWLHEYFLHFHPDLKVNLVSITEEPLNQDLFYEHDDIINRLKALNRELNTTNKTIISINKKQQDVSKYEEKAEKINLEIARLQNIIADNTNVNQLKVVLAKIIEHVLYQRFLSVSNIREISEDSNIQKLFLHLQSVSGSGPSTSSTSSSSSSSSSPSGFGHALSPAFFSIEPKIFSEAILTGLQSRSIRSTSSSSSTSSSFDSSL